MDAVGIEPTTLPGHVTGYVTKTEKSRNASGTMYTILYTYFCRRGAGSFQQAVGVLLATAVLFL
jgi:hypothetical protein